MYTPIVIGQNEGMFMLYKNKLPTHEDIVWLSRVITRYPVDRMQVTHVARMWNCPAEVVALTRELPRDSLFAGRTELTQKLEALRLGIRKQWETPIHN